MHFLIMFIFLYLYTYYIHILNILHSKYLLAKSKYQIYHIYFGCLVYVQGVFRMGVIICPVGICPGV